MLFSPAFLEELQSKIDIVSVISKYVPLEQKGRLFWGRCPFHNEKTPSFSVYPVEQFYHCYGCKESGNAINFIKKMENLGFVEAVQLLAEQVGMPIPAESNETSEKEIKHRKECLAALKEAAIHYHENLNTNEGKAAREYLEKRKLGQGTIKTFGIGVSVDFEEVLKHLRSKGFSDKVLLDSGIAKKKEGRMYDAIGGRIAFPIINVSGNVVAFSGRTLNPKPDFAKYLNTEETVVFSKSKNLFAVNLLKRNKQKEPITFVIVVEGQMDVISLHKAGFKTAIASMGTALTADQAKLIKRFVNKVYICYDGDAAGKKATLRGLDILKDQGLDVKVVSLPEGMDPDDVINKMGREGYQKLLDNALPLVEFKLRSLKGQFDLSNLDGKTKYTEAALEVLRELKSAVEREAYLSLVYDISGISKDFLKRQMETGVAGLVSTFAETKEQVASKITTVDSETKTDIPTKPEMFILACLYHDFEVSTISSSEGLFTPKASEIFNFLIENKIKATQFLERFKNDAGIVGEIVNFNFFSTKKEKIEKELEDCLRAVKRMKLEEEEKSILAELAQTIEQSKKTELLKRLKEIMIQKK